MDVWSVQTGGATAPPGHGPAPDLSLPCKGRCVLIISKILAIYKNRMHLDSDGGHFKSRVWFVVTAGTLGNRQQHNNNLIEQANEILLGKEGRC